MEYKELIIGNASDTAKSTNTQFKSMKNTSNIKTTETQTKLTQENFRTSIFSVEDFLARHSALLEEGKASMIPEARCFLILQEYLKLKDLHIFSLKTSKGYSITAMGKLSPQLFKRFQNWGMIFNGWFLTANFSEFPRTGNVFIIGNIRGTARPEILPIGEDAEKIQRLSENKAVEEKISFRENKISPTLSTKMGTGGNNVPMVTRTLDANMYKGITPEGFYDKSKRNIINQGQLRRLTPVECERLLGFPDKWTEGVSDTQRYKQLGNAVTVNVIEAIIRKIK